MTSKSGSQPSEQNALAQMKQNIPVMLTDLSIFDNGYALMKERFKREMMRIDQQMNKFSSDLMSLYGETSTVQTNIGTASAHHGSPKVEETKADWEVLKTSPLVVGEGKDKSLKLQFDVSQFDAEEIKVKLLNDMLIVTASHEEKTPDTAVYREYNRQFKLPPGMNPELVVSTLSRDGVLTVEAPLPPPLPVTFADDTTSYFSETQ